VSEAAASLIARTDKALAGLEADAIASMNLALTNSYLQLEKQLLAAYPNYTAAAQPNLLANQRALLLFDELKTVLSASSMDAVKPALEKVYEKVLGAAAGEGTTLSDELMRLRGGDSFVTATGKVPIEAIAQAAKNAAELVVGKDQAFKAEARYLIIQGLATGAGGRKVAGQLRQRLGVSKGRAENIARTEINRAQNEAAKVNYKTNGIEYFQSIATADGRLCPYCGDRNGNVYRLDEASIPYHGGCRCYAAPFSPHWEDLGLTSNEWVKDFHDEGLALLEKQGGKANKGPTYFEKKAGMTTAPKPVWSPGKGYLVDKAKLLAADPFMLEKAAAEKAKEQAVEEKKPTKAKKKSEKAPKVPKAKAKKEAQAIAGNGLKSHDETFEYNGNPDEIFENSTTESDYNKKMDAYEKKSIAQLKKYGLTDQEAKYALAGIHEWTETDAGSKKLSDLSLKGKISDKLDGLEALLEKVPGYDGPVYKGASFATEKEYENFLTEFKTGGQTLSISEFSSNINVAAKDMLKGKEIKAVVAVKGNKSGVSISNLSYYGQKKFEVLVP
jgi:SPP1 gp7 family putative phage head morphogenesis protein